MPYQYRVVTHDGKIYVEHRPADDSMEWRHAMDVYWDVFGSEYRHYYVWFLTVWGAKRWIRKQVKKDKKAAERKAEKAKDPVVVWGPYP